MKRIATAAAVLAAAAVLSGCASLITGGELIRPGEPTGIIQVNNRTSHAMNVVLISSCNASTYGLNRLPSGTAIRSGGSYQFTVSAGCWDVDGGVIGVGEARQRLTVSPGRITPYTISD